MAQKPALKIAETGKDNAQASKAAPARARARHRLIRFAFVLVVIVPTALSIAYLYMRAADQYHSATAFSVRSEEFSNPLEAIGAFTQVGSTGASDSEIIYDFITSQPLVLEVDERVDLQAIFRRWPDDVVFSLGAEPTREELLSYWNRMVKVSIDTGSGVLEVEVRAFNANDAQLINRTILDLSAEVVEDLSRIAREDAMRFARDDVNAAEERLREVRRAVRVFRTENQIIDPGADVASRMGVISALQTSLAETLIERGTILSFTDSNDLRIQNLDRRIAAIREQIEAERLSVGGSVGAAASLSDVVGNYEELLVELEFSQNAYTAALAAEEQARAEARRKSRYLAVHIPPTLAEQSIYPQRLLLSGLIFIGLLTIWATMTLIYYNVRDRG